MTKIIRKTSKDNIWTDNGSIRSKKIGQIKKIIWKNFACRTEFMSQGYRKQQNFMKKCVKKVRLLFLNIINSKKFGQTELIKVSIQCFSMLFCMQNLKPNNLEFFVRPNSKRKVVDSPMIILA